MSNEEGDQGNSRSRRQTAGKKILDPNFVWPTNFGSNNEQADLNDNADVETKTSMDEIDKRKKRSLKSVSRKSHYSVKLQQLNNDTEKRRLLLEKKIKELEIEKHLSELQILELDRKMEENKLLDEDAESQQDVMSIDSTFEEGIDKNLSFKGNAKSFVGEWVEETRKMETLHEEKSILDNNCIGINDLCVAMTNAFKSIDNRRSNERSEKMLTRNTIERDFPIFDGKPEDWPTFIYQFRKISSLCEYSPEESMIKLQKCLRGEAKNAVLGMMMCPENLNDVIKTLETRFGRPDQIIDTMIFKIEKLPAIRDNEMEQLILFSNNVTSLVSTIKSLHYDMHLQNPHLLKKLCHKLPDMLKLRWGEEICSRNGNVSLADFAKWLTNLANAACYISNNKPSSRESHQTRRNERSLVLTSRSPSIFCFDCRKKGHNLEKCTKFQSRTSDERWTIVSQNKLCFSCLQNKHRTCACPTKKHCGIDNCELFHNKLLHKERQNLGESSNEPSSSSRTERVHTLENGENRVLLRIVNVKLYGPDNRCIQTAALCDEASTVTLVDRSILKELDVKGIKQPLCIQWTNNISHQEDSECLDLEISGDYNDANRFKLKNVRTVENIALPTQKTRIEEWQKYPHLNRLPISSVKRTPMILIGQDNIHLTLPRRIAQGPENAPIATKTKLGWILHGKISDNCAKITYNYHICNKDLTNDYLHQLVKNSFTIDSLGVTAVKKIEKSKEEAKAKAALSRNNFFNSEKSRKDFLNKEDSSTKIIKNLEEEILALQQRLNQSNKAKDELNKTISKQNKRIKSLEDKNKEYVSKVNEAVQVVEEEIGKVSKSSLEAIEEAELKLKSEFDQVKSDFNTNLRTVLDDLKKAHSDSVLRQNEINTYAESCDLLENEIERLQTKRGRMEDENEGNSKLLVLKKNLEKTFQKLLPSENENIVLNAEISCLKSDMKQMVGHFENDVRTREIEKKKLLASMKDERIAGDKKYLELMKEKLRDEPLQTVLAEIENIVNSRPLTKVTTDPDDYEALTPNHFIFGDTCRDEFGVIGEMPDLRKQWRRAQRIANDFWKRWSKEYLPTLTKRNRWHKDVENLKIGDIVTIIDENLPCNSWKIGKITEIFPGLDERVRVVTVKTRD